jgi:ABC-type cobalamin/Fe3+-siderophores transport systems, ATPase components
MTDTFSSSVFSLQNVTFDVPERRLIDDMSLEIHRGVTALIGRNGSSKSTLLRMLAAQTRPGAGRILYEGTALSERRGRALARELAFLPQVTPPTEGLSLIELVRLGRYPWRGALGRLGPDDHRLVEAAITQCGLSGLEDRLVDTLSGGERQRGWIAMMLAQEARTLLLDEPISALDIAHQIEVLGLLARTAKARGISSVIVLHDVNMALRFCDHVVALQDGKVVVEGASDVLLNPDHLEKIYGVRMQVLPATPSAAIHPL